MKKVVWKAAMKAVSKAVSMVERWAVWKAVLLVGGTAALKAVLTAALLVDCWVVWSVDSSAARWVVSRVVQ